MLNGQKIELTPEQYKKVNEVISAPKNKDCFDREHGAKYFYIDSDGCINSIEDHATLTDALRYGDANYCFDRELLSRRARYEAFERVLWRFSERHGGAGVYYLFYDKKSKSFDYVVGHGTWMFGPSFTSPFVADMAISYIGEWLTSQNWSMEDII